MTVQADLSSRIDLGHGAELPRLRWCASKGVRPMIVANLSALAEPTRLEAMRILVGGSELCVCDLMRQLGATQSRMSRHMQILKRAGLVVDRRDAQWERYRVQPGIVAASDTAGPGRAGSRVRGQGV
jgi:ArsR family transcriptional regulator